MQELVRIIATSFQVLLGYHLPRSPASLHLCFRRPCGHQRAMAQPRETTTKINNGPAVAPSPVFTMEAERRHIVFDKRRLSEVLHGGKQELEA